MKRKHSELKKFIVYFILVVLFMWASDFFLYGIGSTRRSIPGIPDPVQTETDGHTSFNMSGYLVDIYYCYEYDIEALVVHTNRHRMWWNIGDKLSPIDCALCWGKVAEVNNRIDFNWGQTGRYSHWKASPGELADVGLDINYVSTHSSNNHLIPETSKIKRKIMKIKPGDHIRIKGYLVQLDGMKSNGESFEWASSFTREDTGDGACELIYVTDIQFLG